MSRRVPVSLDNLAMGLKKAEGLLFVEENQLVLELQQVDAILEIFKDEVKTYRIGLEEIDSVSLTKKWFRHFLMINGKRMKAMQDIPGSAHAQLKLHVKRSDVDNARRLVSAVQLTISEQKLRELDQ
ncbi:MAG: hypothetical protein ACQETE_15685 [Bacteroidota bacterium]